jgi:hypothetical protein
VSPLKYGSSGIKTIARKDAAAVETAVDKLHKLRRSKELHYILPMLSRVVL